MQYYFFFNLFMIKLKNPIYVYSLYYYYSSSISSGNMSKLVKFVFPWKGSNVDCSYVRRVGRHLSAYLSSHNGCTMKCNFCYLTNTKQNKFNHVNHELYSEQLNKILKHAKTIDGNESSNTFVNVNMMSRGEPLANKYLVKEYPKFYKTMESVVKLNGYKGPKIIVNTVMPYTVRRRELIDIFQYRPVHLNYSLYTVNEDVRKKMVPNSIHYMEALTKLKNYQEISDMPLTIRFALIQGKSDYFEEALHFAETVDKFNFEKLNFDIVKFNPNTIPGIHSITEECHEVDQILTVFQQVSSENDMVSQYL